jgi:hypothetical protein
MAYKTKYKPENPEKYLGNINSIICRSLWERRVCKFFDMNRNVIKWSSEELSIPYYSNVDNKWHKYYPDFLIEKISSSNKKEILLIEVKPKKQTEKPIRGKKKKKTYISECIQYEINQAKWKAAREYSNKKGWFFKVLTENDIFPINKNKGLT